MANAVTETKAQRVERLKREKNPWEGLDDIRRFAREGFDSITPEWLGTYFRWWGVYTQGDGAGVIGGKNGEGKALPYFMVRIRIPNGLLHSHQLRTIANVTEKYARGTADLTVRQNIQLHWVTIQDLPSSKSASPAATSGAPIPRLTMSASLPFARAVKIPRLAFPYAWAADSRPILISGFV